MSLKHKRAARTTWGIQEGTGWAFILAGVMFVMAVVLFLA